MLRTIFLFELGDRLRRISTWVYFAVFLGLGFLLTVIAGGAFKGAVVSFGASGKVMINSPYSLHLFIAFLSYFGLLVIGIGAALRFGADPVALIIGLSLIMPAAVLEAWRARPAVDPDAPALAPDDPAWERWNPWLARERGGSEDADE